MLLLGAMSGTSTDGVDVAAIRCHTDQPTLQFLGSISRAFDDGLRRRLLVLQQMPAVFDASTDPLDFMLQVRRDLTDCYIEAVHALVSKFSLNLAEVQALGAHGQTLRHKPNSGYTYQMLDGARLAVGTQIQVVTDFRSADVALGGQGAPLVPAFHAAWLRSRSTHTACAVLNLGGFSNLTICSSAGVVLAGGDCGPANCLMDLWAQTRFNLAFDTNGEIAQRGRVHGGLLAAFLQHPFFASSWPKSTGRDDFSNDWFWGCLKQCPDQPSNEDVMATLLALSVECVKQCLPGAITQIYVCGGGANNKALLEKLRACLVEVQVDLSSDMGLPEQAVEASAFAWMAGQTLQNKPSNCPVVTGAQQSGVLGAVYHPGHTGSGDFR